MKIKEILKTVTFRQLGVTFPATVINGLLGALFYILTARILGPEEFGLLVVSITTLTLIADITDFGVQNSVIRFVSENLEKDKQVAFKYLKLALEFKVFIAFLVGALGFVLAPFIADLFFGKPELTTPLRLSFVGVGTAQLLTYFVSFFQAHQKYWGWASVQIGSNSLRITIILLLIYISSLNLFSSLLIYITMPLISFLAAFLFIPKDFLKVKNEKDVSKPLFNYSKWVALFIFLAAISARLDTFISARLLSPKELGLYGAASQLVTIVPQLIVALNAVISPKLAGMGSKQEMIEYFKKIQLMALGLAILGLIGIPIGSFVLNNFYGSAYTESIPIFIVLLLAMLVFLVSIPVHDVILYYYSYPKLFVWLSVGHMITVGVLGTILISTYGPMGGAVTVFVGMIFNFLIPTFWVLKKLRK